MDMPTPCSRCGETQDFSEFRHNPACNCRLENKCDNYICEKCYNEIKRELG